MTTINYASLQARATDLIKTYGFVVSVAREGTKIFSSHGIFMTKTQADETASRSNLLAQTALTTRTMYIAATSKIPPQVGDILNAERINYTITDVEIMRPTSTNIYYKVEVT